mgnify:CR=1 FL=1
MQLLSMSDWEDEVKPCFYIAYGYFWAPSNFSSLLIVSGAEPS